MCLTLSAVLLITHETRFWFIKPKWVYNVRSSVGYTRLRPREMSSSFSLESIHHTRAWGKRKPITFSYYLEVISIPL